MIEKIKSIGRNIPCYHPLARASRQLLQLLKLRIERPDYTGKVFCIGYNKTGTTTMGKSFEMLGFRNSSFNKKVWELYKNDEYDKILNYTAKYESFDDLPWLKADMIPLLDKTFPGSKFVYLEREEATWKKSFYEWNLKVYNKKTDVEKAWKAYKEHERFVYNYFKDRPSTDFLVLDVKDPKGFKKLADFLEVSSNREKFPHFNKT